MESERGTVPPFALPAPLGQGNRLLTCPVCPQGQGGWGQVVASSLQLKELVRCGVSTECDNPPEGLTNLVCLGAGCRSV